MTKLHLLPEVLFGTAMNRRTFLKLAGAGATALAGRSVAAPAASWSEKQVVLRSEGIPGGGMIQNFTSASEPLDAGKWRLWLSVSGKVPFNVGIAEGVPGEKMTVHLAELSPGEPADAPLAIGNLPEGWRPVQGVHLPLRNGRHRLYFWAHGQGIVRYLAADSEDGRRFRVVDPLRPCIYHPSDRAVGGPALAEAGLTKRANRVASPIPGEPLAAAMLITNDATNVYQLRDGSFELYTASLLQVEKDDPRYMAHDNTPGWVRVIDRLRSDDGLKWTDRRRVIVTDAQDPIDQQFYYLAVTHTERGRVGLLGHYRVQAQTMDIERCFSDDGIIWKRPAREAWLPRSAPGALPDSYGAYASHSLVQYGGKWHLFYTGVNDAHNHKDSHGAATRAIMHATIDSILA